MLIFGLDFETTGVDPEKDRIIEVGYELFDWSGRVMRSASFFVSHDPHIKIPQEITDITHITQAMYDFLQVPEQVAIDAIITIGREANFFMAHNAEFEQGFLTAACNRLVSGLPKIEWIDTASDVPFPSKIQTRRLTYLCADHDIPVEGAHRALVDVGLMRKLAIKYPMEEVLNLQRSPTIKVIAKVSFDEKEKAKARGFYWDAAKKIWFRNMKQCLYNPSDFDFRTEMIIQLKPAVEQQTISQDLFS